jgi:methionyl-tRNA formyltransferase
MKITFYLMSQKGYAVLDYLCNTKKKSIISMVIIGEDKNIEDDYANQIKNLCIDNNIDYFFKDDKFEVNSTYSFAISWKWLIGQDSSKLIVLHDSILPKYRGFAPLVNMLINQETTIGVTALLATNQYDKGDIIIQETTKISYPIKIKEAINLISTNYTSVVNNLIQLVKDNKIICGVKQNEKEASYSLWLSEDDYVINWEHSSIKILNFINAVSSPYKGALTFINGKQKIRILDAEIVDDVKIENRNNGKIIFIKDNYPIIVCGVGLLKLTNVVDDVTGSNILPFKMFRIKLKNENTI